MKLKYYISLFIYYAILQHLPNTTFPIIGHLCRKLRYLACRNIFKKCGKNIDICRKVHFGRGTDIEIANNSSLGPNMKIHNTSLKIGNYVITAPDILIQGGGHKHDSPLIPIGMQGNLPKSELEIKDDVWIGTRAIILGNVRTIGTGAIIGAGSVVTKPVPDYAIIAGNPARIIRYRTKEETNSKN